MSKKQRFMLLGIAAVIAIVAIVVAVSSGGSTKKKTSTTSSQTSNGKTVGGPATPTTTQIDVKGGQASGGVKKISVKDGDQVRILVTVDKPQDIHLHGYDIEKPAKPSTPVVFQFKADKQGVFELESHASNQKIAQLTVHP
ncbi:MAG: hypothetical protein QOJ07_756 [Thermoleophilaceae bacterium]|nr:hypothetical protein [Thermoleophilaceae bacterium]